MAGAPYQFDQTISDDATFEFSLELTNDDGTDFAWDDYTFEYVVSGQNGGCYPNFRLTSDSGITVTADQNLITFAYATMPYRGRYAHACRATHTATDKVVPLFDGFLTITEGNF